MSENALKPQIRFKGFTEAWEQRKLGELVNRITRKNEDGLCDLPLTISAENGLVDQCSFFNNRVASQNLINYFLLYEGDFAYNKSTSAGAKWGAVKRLDLYKSGVLSTLYIVFRPIDVNSEYLVHYYETDYWHPEMQKIATEGARNHGLLNISPVDFFQSNIKCPKTENEQQKIGKLFLKLNFLITLHQRKCERLQALKKGLLEKMFPAEGKLTPVIRFKGFTEVWEQRKLKELCVYEPSNITSQDISLIGEYELFDANSSIGRTDKHVIKKEYISIIKDGAGVGRIRKLPKNTAILGTMGAIKAEYCEYDFLFSLLEKANLGASFSGSTIPHIYFKDYGENNYFIPSALEQKAIGKFFEKLDSLITLHQRESFIVD